MEIKLLTRIIPRIKISGDCWEWIGGVINNRDIGYGVMIINKKKVLVHRIIYSIFHGSIPSGKLVMHSCDNRLCCNPDHLMIGDERLNQIDCLIKGRHPSSKLTQYDVSEINKMRMNGYSVKDIAKRFNITEGYVRMLKHKKNHYAPKTLRIDAEIGEKP